jgi:hypothetical protein
VAAGLVTVGLAALFLGATLLADVARGAWKAAPVLVLAAVAFWAAVEIARYDHGFTDVLVKVGWVGAPVVLIVCGALWGSRRFYGYPDLGPHPGRAALVALAIVLGVQVGRSLSLGDAAESERRALAIERDVLAWRDGHGGAWPATLAEAAPDAPTSRMGSVRPPPFAYAREGEGATLAFPLSGGRRRVRLLGQGTWRVEEGP